MQEKEVSMTVMESGHCLKGTPFDVDGYDKLADVLLSAFEQSSGGKGKERHANDLPFDQQPIATIQSLVGPGFALGQAIKKIQESQRMNTQAAKRELLGAIVYIAGAIIHLEKNE